MALVVGICLLLKAMTSLKCISRRTAFKSWRLFPSVVAVGALLLRFDSHGAEFLKPTPGAEKKDTLY